MDVPELIELAALPGLVAVETLHREQSAIRQSPVYDLTAVRESGAAHVPVAGERVVLWLNASKIATSLVPNLQCASPEVLQDPVHYLLLIGR